MASSKNLKSTIDMDSPVEGANDAKNTLNTLAGNSATDKRYSDNNSSEIICVQNLTTQASTSSNKRPCDDEDDKCGEEGTMQVTKLRCLRDKENNYNKSCTAVSFPYQLNNCVEVNSNLPCLSNVRHESGIRTSEADNDGNGMHINELPHMILTRILSNLNLYDLLKRASLVCKYWKDLVYDPFLWRYINLRGLVKVDDVALMHLVQLSKNVKYLDITDSKLVTSEGLIKSLKYCKSLQTLKIVRCQQLSTKALETIGSSCPNLRTLYTDSCYCLTDSALKQIVHGCGTHMQELRLSFCGNIGDAGIRDIANNCKHLKHLTLTQCNKISNSCMADLVWGCKKLETLQLMSCTLSDCGLQELAKLKNLKTLDVSNITCVTVKSIGNIAEKCRELESLNLSLCSLIDDQCIESISRVARNLKRLYLVSCNLTNKALYSIAAHSKNIEMVDVGWCQLITLEGVLRISEKCKSTLTYLGLMRCDQVHAVEMDDVVVQYPSIMFSTMHLDCQRLLDRARKEGHLI